MHIDVNRDRKQQSVLYMTDHENIDVKHVRTTNGIYIFIISLHHRILIYIVFVDSVKSINVR